MNKQLPSRHRTTPTWAIVIGASTGGPRAVEQVLRQLPAQIPAVVLVVQHMPPGFTRSFAERLDAQCAISVKEGEHGEILRAGTVYVAPGGFHMRLQRFRLNTVCIILEKGRPVHNVRPAADVTLKDAADVFGPCTIGIVLTGMGADGRDGLRHVKSHGGITIAQDRETSVIHGMPRAAIESGVVDQVLPLDKIPKAIVDILWGRDLRSKRPSRN